MKELICDIRKNAIDHGSLPFWSWNDKLQPEELRRQIRVMHDLGMNGFFMHARGGLETEYLSEDWYTCINACIDEAEKLGMEAWSYDENGWPSGFAGGKLLEDPALQATWLELRRSADFPAEFDSEVRQKLLGVYVQNGNQIRRVTEPEDASEYLSVWQRWDDSYVDTMNPAVSKRFLEETHENYLKNVQNGAFGGSMPGFFTDEPQYYRWHTPWSEIMPEEFRKNYGYDVVNLLPALFIDCDGAEEFRYDYYYLCHKSFIQNFARPVYEWCHEHNCRLTGHAVEETVLFGQMWCCGGVMPFYEYEDIPGMDYLGRGLTSDLAPKQLGSACAQLGKKKVMSEMFACCGWDVSPRELKRIAELQYVGGVNMMCQHLYAYSIHGQRKRDYPANYSEHLPWQKYLKPFNTYFNNLGALLSHGTESVNTLVIHPIHSAYLYYKRDEDRASIEELEEKTRALSDLLSGNQIPYHYGDESMMARLASVEGAKIRVGNCVYDHVILPCIYSLDSSTASLLREFVNNGGKIWLYDRAPDRIDGRRAGLTWLASNTTFDEIRAAAECRVTLNGAAANDLRMQVRNLDGGRLVYLVNLSDNKAENITLHIEHCGNVARLDMNTLEAFAVAGRRNSDGSADILLNLASAESVILLEDPEAPADFLPAVPRSAKSIVFSEPFRMVGNPENALTLDRCALSYDGVNFTDEHPIEAVRDELLHSRYRGEVTLRFAFDVRELPQTLNLAVEPMKYHALLVNGQPLTLSDNWWLDRSFRTADITALVKSGRNELTVSFDYFQRDYVYHVLYDGVSEALRNCLWFDTEVECVYLYGDFSVVTDAPYIPGEKNSLCCDGGFAIAAPTMPDMVNVVTGGYPFFAGAMSFTSHPVWHPGDGTLLTLGGRWAVCEVTVNGKSAGTLLFDESIDLAGALRDGENEITLTLYNSNRNLLGPHHRDDPEPFGVGPKTFSYEGQWQDWKCDEYVPRYAFVRFGADVK